MKKVSCRAWIKIADLETGAKLILAYDKLGNPLFKKGRFCFYDTRWDTVF